MDKNILAVAFEPLDKSVVKNEPVHEISNNEVYATSKGSDQPA